MAHVQANRMLRLTPATIDAAGSHFRQPGGVGPASPAAGRRPAGVEWTRFDRPAHRPLERTQNSCQLLTMTRFTIRAAALCLACLLGAFPAAAQTRAAPEAASGWQSQTLATASRHMVVAAQPDAAAAGLAVLRAGGNAIDAAIAIQLVLTLVEPQSSGIGGGAFLLFHDSRTGAPTAWDGRETAPAGVSPDLFLDRDGKPMGFRHAVVGGRAVGVPGVVALMADAHAAHGRLRWADLFAPAIALARNGFTVGPRLAALLAGANGDALRAQPTTRDYFFPDGKPLANGDVVRNPALAETLERIAAGGRDAFYSGALAGDIADAVRSHGGNPGYLTRRDMAAYEARRREPVCSRYRVWRICGMGPPSSGGIAVAQILGILERFDLPATKPPDAHPWHLLAEASKLAFADRNRYVADSDFAAVPLPGLLEPRYLASRAAQIDSAAVLAAPVAAGEPENSGAHPILAPDTGNGRPGTSQISVVDDAGNAVTMTTSIEGAFGAHIMVRGFLLNNQLTDFSFHPTIDGAPVANAVAPGKRPRSSMAPTLVYGPDGALRLVLGSPGGSRIIGYVAQALVAMLDWDLDAQAAVGLPHLVNRNGATEVENGADADRLAAALAARGHSVRRADMTSGLNVIEIRDGVLYGGADPRRESVAIGD